MVQLQQRFAYRYKSKQGVKDHYRFQVTIPEEFIEALGWKAGDDLNFKLSADARSLSLLRKEEKSGGVVRKRSADSKGS